MRVWIAAVALAAPALALAQQTTTHCTTLFNQVNCNSTTYKNGGGGFGEGFARGMQAGQGQPNFGEIVRARRLHQAVGRRVAAGDCQGARALALNAGDLDLASKVQAVCAPPESTPSPAQ